METGKPGLASAPVHINSSAAQTEKRMDIQAPPLMAVYIPTVSALPVQPYSQPPAPATLHLAMPPLYSMETLPFLTLHIAGGLQSQAGLSLAAVSPSARTKSTGKHVCPHCGRDCMKPSVLEKHLRCHTGERPYPCTTCGISFKTQSNLYKHKRTQAHARLSSESDQSCQGSLDSMSSSRETCTFSLSLEESGRMEDDTTPPAPESTSPARTAKVSSAQMHGAVGEQNELNTADCQTKETNECTEITAEGEKERMENKKILQNASRHLPLQRQEATLFSKQWESSASRGKSQSHESTDSGFSESSDHHPSPGSILLDHSMDSLAESTKEHLEETADTQTSSERGHDAQETMQVARKQEQKTLEERISKLISDNSAVVEDKQLENVRPRKTVLSKQGSIDLPMPYTYKDSFHFDMRISQTQNVGLQRNRMAGFYSSVPTQHSTTREHAPLLRSNSLPFSVALLQPERSTPTSSIQSDYLTLIRRRSSGQINPTGFTSKSVNKQPPTHRPLVRQIAVDCNHATDSLYSSSVEEECTASLSCDRDNSDNGGEPSNRKCRRKKTQKFAYNKWYMYRGGTFKKLYGAEKGANNSVTKGKKCSTNPDPDVVQGLQKRQTEVHKETVMTARSAVTFTSSSSAKVCHPECPPAKLSQVPAADFNPKTGHLPTSLSSLAPLGKNLSSSVLPLPPTVSLVNYKTGSLSRAEVKEKRSDSGSQLCRSHIPSDRKKQKTDEEPLFPLETDPDTWTYAPPSATGGAPQQALNPRYVNLRDELKHAQLKGVLFPPSISNANTAPVSTSSATSTPSAAKKSFLPKYQLRLPNAAEPASNASPQVAVKATVTGCCDVSALSSCNIEQTPVKTVVFSSTQTQLSLACTAAALCQAGSSSLNHKAKSSLAAHRQLATATITTTCRRDHQAGLCSSSKKPSKSTGVSVAVANFPAAPAITTANHQTSAAAITAFSPGQTDHPLPHARLLPASDQSGLIGSNIPTVPCQIVPFDQTQTPAQNVFHVHTADLQICLQIISDEQLALIEPQIERPTGGAPSQRRDTEAAMPEAIQKSAQSSGTTGIHGEVKDRRHSAHQKELDQRESLAMLNAERVRPQRPEQVGEAESNPPRTEQGTFPKARVSADSGPPETQGLTRRPHNYVNVNTVTDTQNKTTDVLPTLASHIIETSGRSPTSAERPIPSLNRCAEAQPLPESRVSQGVSVSPTLCGQHKLDTTCLASSRANLNCMRIEISENENQDKFRNQAGTMKAEGGSSACSGSELETHPSPQDLLVRTSGTDEPSVSVQSFSINKCKAPGQLNPQASIHCSDPVEYPSSETPGSSKHEQMRCDLLNPASHSAAAFQEMTLSESEDVIRSAPSVSANVQVERPKDIPAVPTNMQSPTAGLVEGRAAQRGPQTRGHGGTPGPPDNRAQRPVQNPEAREAKDQCEERDDGGMGGEVKTDVEPGQRGRADACLQHTTRPQSEEIPANMDSLKTQWLSEQYLSTTHSGMSGYPQRGPQRALNVLNNLDLPAPRSQTCISSPPLPPLETNRLCFSQHWESSAARDQRPQKLCSYADLMKTQGPWADTQNALSQIDSSPQTLSKRDGIAPCVQRGNAAISSTSGSHIITSPEVIPCHAADPHGVSCSAHLSRDAVGLTWGPQESNGNMLDDNTPPPSKPCTYLEMAHYLEAPSEYASQGGTFGRSDTADKYQSFFFSGQLHGFPAAEGLGAGVRAVPSCQGHAEDASSSDDEGKLIIEL